MLVNLGCIYRDLGETDQALIATVKAVDIDESNIEARQNLKSLASDIKINELNSDYATKAMRLCSTVMIFLIASCAHFIQEFLERIQAAAKLDPIISDGNSAFYELAPIGDSENFDVTDPTPSGD